MSEHYPGKKFLALAAAGLLGSVVLAGYSTDKGRSKPTHEASSPAASGYASPDTCSSLASFNLIGPAKNGGENAVNTGECAAMYDPVTQQRVGQIAGGQAFIIHCDTSKPASLGVEAGGAIGRTNLDGAALQQFNQGVSAATPDC